MSILYLPKINQRILGSELLIVNEVHIVGITSVATVTTDYIRLIEAPLQEVPSSIIISGFTEVVVTPGTNEFKVDYANGRILFEHTRNGDTVYVTYKGRGSIIDGEDINELQAPVGKVLDYNVDIDSYLLEVTNISGNPGSPKAGDIWFDTTTKQFKGWNGTNVVILG